MNNLSATLRNVSRNARAVRDLAAAVVDRDRPFMAHVVVTRRCNLTCGYCYEADRVSPPVATNTVKAWIDHLARLRVVFVTLTGGEPLLHPDIIELVAYVRDKGMTPVMNSNAYLMNRNRIEAFNDAGLFALQVSIDNVRANEVTQKSLKPLTPKLKLLSEHARFQVRINTVLGSGEPEEAVRVTQSVLEYSFDAKCSLVRDERGAVMPVDAAGRAAYKRIRTLGRRAPRYLSEDFQKTLIDQGETDLKCRAGARYFTVCDKGLVHLCESSYMSPGTPLLDYTVEDIRTASNTRKPCASTCAVAYAHQASRADAWRSQRLLPSRAVKQCWEQVVGIGDAKRVFLPTIKRAA